MSQEAAGAAAHEAAKESSLEVLNFIHLATDYVHGAAGEFLHRYENLIFGLIVISVLASVFYFASRSAKADAVPGRLQSACEGIVGGLEGFVIGILGERGRKYVPFLGTIFLYIWTMNLLGLLPLMHNPNANAMTLTVGPISLPIPTTTAALALLVFVYVQSIGVKENGIVGYLDHMAGQPRDAFGWAMVPLMFPIHLIGEIAKPLSLAFRLYGNIWGEDVLLAVFIGLGVGATAFLPVPSGLPLHFPFLLLALVTGTIQAFVFTLLSTVYIAMMLPHEDHAHEKHAPEHAAH
ncbi:MAG TPA: F0F1 ATP synthase subunit A [Candidatus Eisenbacteria bacterium]|jgi:F-type H+-transporting ATPase subunit a|nr:F0F1 ATP synthase subunit A [Candidatus Eisenbacteria bacterium]